MSKKIEKYEKKWEQIWENMIELEQNRLIICVVFYFIWVMSNEWCAIILIRYDENTDEHNYTAALMQVSRAYNAMPSSNLHVIRCQWIW